MATKHPGKTAAQRAILDQIGGGDYCPRGNAKTFAKLVELGLLVRLADKVLGRDGFGVIAIPQFEMPIPVHYQWCSYWADQPDDEATHPERQSNDPGK